MTSFEGGAKCRVLARASVERESNRERELGRGGGRRRLRSRACCRAGCARLVLFDLNSSAGWTGRSRRRTMAAGPLAAPAATAGSAPARSLYRSLLRTARRMPDDHRTAFVVHRIRSEFEKSRKLTEQAAVAARLHEGEVYRDQLELQAAHLSALAKQALLIPVDLRKPVASSSSSAPSTSSAAGTASSTPSSTATTTAAITTLSSRKGPSRPPRPRRVPPPSDTNSSPADEAESAPPSSSDPQPSPHDPLDRRKLLRAFSARDSQSEVQAARTNRFMQGPEPSWVLRRRRRQQEQEQVQGGTAERGKRKDDSGDHGGGCCGGHHDVETRT